MITAGILVLGRIFSSSWANVLQKKLRDRELSPLLIVTTNFVLLAFMLLPFFMNFGFQGLSTAFWYNIILSILLEIPGNIFLIKSVGAVDLSIFGPLNSYKPIIALIPGIFILAEIPSLQGLAGMCVIFAGSVFLASDGRTVSYKSAAALLRDKGVQFRFLSLFMIASGSIFLKGAINESTALHTFIIWTFLGLPLSLLSFILLDTQGFSANLRKVQKNFLQLATLAVVFLLLQFLTLKIFSLIKVAYALSLFQLSATLNVFFGHRIFREKNILPRAIGSVIMVAGAMLILLAP